MLLHDLSGLCVITGVLTRGRQEGPSRRTRHDEGADVREAGRRKGAKERERAFEDATPQHLPEHGGRACEPRRAGSPRGWRKEASRPPRAPSRNAVLSPPWLQHTGTRF